MDWKLPLLPADVEVLRFTQLRLAAHAHDATQAQAFSDRTKSPTHAYRDTRIEVGTVQMHMRRDDRVDADCFATVEENNDKLRYGSSSRVRRAFIGLDLADVLDDEESLRLLNATRRTDWDRLRDEALSPRF